MVTSEKELVYRIVKFLRNDGYQVVLEAPNMGQSVDLVGIKDNTLTLIEAKISDWSRAIDQCRAHQLVADYICIALGKRISSERLIESVKKLGYGIISCDPDSENCSWLFRPRKNENVWTPQKAIFSKNIKELTHAC